MLYEQLLYEKNFRQTPYKKFYNNQKYIYRCTSEALDTVEIKKILTFVNSISTLIKLPIIFDFGKIRITDKLSYILLENICYYLISEKRYSVVVFIEPETTIVNNGFKKSPLLKLVNFKRQTQDEYVKSFNSITTMNNYRRIIKLCDNSDKTSIVTSDVCSILEHLSIANDCKNEVCGVIGELIDNAIDHAQSDCLVDIDIALNYSKKDSTGTYYGINIVIYDYSNNLLGEDIEKNFKNNTDFNCWYEKLKEAWKFHSQHWDANYLEKDFFTMASFQRRVSGRNSNYKTGGTGLTKLISALESRSDSSQCYVITGDRLLFFKQDCLGLDEHEWTGFNHEKDFLSHLPEKKNLFNSPLYFPGTAYNLNFILKKDDEDECEN